MLAFQNVRSGNNNIGQTLTSWKTAQLHLDDRLLSFVGLPLTATSFSVACCSKRFLARSDSNVKFPGIKIKTLKGFKQTILNRLCMYYFARLFVLYYCYGLCIRNH